MSAPAKHPRPEGDAAGAPAYRHLPEPISLADTVSSMRGDSPPDAGGEQNDFIAAAIPAGG